MTTIFEFSQIYSSNLRLATTANSKLDLINIFTSTDLVEIKWYKLHGITASGLL